MKPRKQRLRCGMGWKLGVTASFLLVTMVEAGSPRSTSGFDDEWRFHLGDVPGAEQASFDDAHWRVLTLPHDWSVEHEFSPTNASGTGYLPGGTGWYRKSFILPEADRDQRFAIEFDGVYRNSDVWINGRHLGHRPNGYVGFQYDLTPYLKFGDDENVLAVRVARENVADSRWYTGTGIYRHVRLTRTGPVHIAPWGVFVTTPMITDAFGDVNTTVEVCNDSDKPRNLRVITQVLDSTDRLLSEAEDQSHLAAGDTHTFTTWQQVKNITRWSLDQPRLYTLNTRVLSDEGLLDEWSTSFGFRSFRFDPGTGFYLNGTNLLLKGVCMHHDAGAVGAAVPVEVLERRLKLVKALGANAVRCSHNPMAPELYALCDQLGLLVMDEAFDEWEIGKRKWVQGRNVGTAERFGYAEAFEEWAERDIAEMVRQHRNHPSIILWSLGNEIDYPTDPYVHPESRVDADFAGFSTRGMPSVTRLTAVAPRLIAAVKREDPTRPVTMALANVPAANGTGLAGMLDVAGYNYQEQDYARDHHNFPQRVIYGSENGRNADSWLVVKQRDYISGLFLWVGFDFLGEANRWPSHGSTSGVFDRCGFLKPASLQFEAFWKDTPVTKLVVSPEGSGRRPRYQAHWTWNASAGEAMTVTAFSNGDEVELLLNGTSLGRRQPNEQAIARWEVPYTPGELTAIGYVDGVACSRDTLRTAGSASRIAAQADATHLEPRGVAHVILEIVDDQGNPLPASDQPVTVTVTGAGRMLGLDNGRQNDPTPLRSPTRVPNDGRLLALVQADANPGEIIFTATAAGLPPTEIKFQVE